jgi:hypothetical protein
MASTKTVRPPRAIEICDCPGCLSGALLARAVEGGDRAFALDIIALIEKHLTTDAGRAKAYIAEMRARLDAEPSSLS